MIYDLCFKSVDYLLCSKQTICFTCVAVYNVLSTDRLIGLVVKASTSRAKDPGFESRLSSDFSGVESYQ